MKVLITGDIGFIGFHLSKALLDAGHNVIGIDNHNDYYKVTLKEARLSVLKEYSHYQHHQIDINDVNNLEDVDFDIIYHLAAQAGVRYSINHPEVYVESNLTGFMKMLEFARKIKPKHFIFASSSSVYGLNQKNPFSIEDEINHPASLYAATKRSNELLAHSYSHLYQIPSTGLRFFTVYGPFGRPDMASFIFTKNISEGKPIEVFNKGDMIRDFTYVGDIVDGLIKLMEKAPQSKTAANPKVNESSAPFKVYNLGNNKPVKLMDYIGEIERLIGKKALIDEKPMQMGDVYKTYADIEISTIDFGFKPKTSYQEGLKKFIDWYKDFYEAK
jgi:UDP-glucuronate 4-epimerase